MTASSSGELRRGWLCTLDPTVGSEIRKTRPCLIVSSDDLNPRLQTIIVAPLTSGGRPARFRVETTFQGVARLISPDQVRAVGRRRAVKRLGTVDEATLGETLRIFGEMFAE